MNRLFDRSILDRFEVHLEARSSQARFMAFPRGVGSLTVVPVDARAMIDKAVIAVA